MLECHLNRFGIYLYSQNAFVNKPFVSYNCRSLERFAVHYKLVTLGSSRQFCLYLFREIVFHSIVVLYVSWEVISLQRKNTVKMSEWFCKTWYYYIKFFYKIPYGLRSTIFINIVLWPLHQRFRPPRRNRKEIYHAVFFL